MSVDRKMTWDELAEDNETLRGQLAEQDARGLRLAGEVERLREKVKRVEQAVQVIHGTRHASPPMDASECVVILRAALAGQPTEEVTPTQTDP